MRFGLLKFAETDMVKMSGEQIVAAANARKQNNSPPGFAARFFKNPT